MTYARDTDQRAIVESPWWFSLRKRTNEVLAWLESSFVSLKWVQRLVIRKVRKIVYPREICQINMLSLC
jgi:hypothetical protein